MKPLPTIFSTLPARAILMTITCLAILPNCSSEEEKSCANGEDPVCGLIFLIDPPVQMLLFMKTTDMGGTGEGDTLTFNVYENTDSSCSGTATKTFQLSVSEHFTASGATATITGSELPAGSQYIRATRGSTQSTCELLVVLSSASNYSCTITNTSLNC